jgi:hypothetical protein
MEYDLVAVWLRKDPIRWLSGALAGVVAGAVAMCVAMALASAMGMEFWFPIKLVGTIGLGPSATEYGTHLPAILTGALIFEALCLFLGVVFAHFTGTNAVRSLLAMGLVWGTFSWIFIWNLFLQSFKPINAVKIPSGAVFPVCIAFGLALACVSVFDRTLRGKKA